MNKRVRSLAMPVAVLSAQASSMASVLLMPRILGARDYTFLVVTLAYGQLLVSLFFEWLRISTLKFANGVNVELAANRFHIIKVTYFTIGVAIFFTTVGGYLSGWISLSLSLAAIYSIFRAYFEGGQALNRARYENGKYSLLWVVNSVGVLFLSLIGAYLTRSGYAVAALTCVAFFISSLGAWKLGGRSQSVQSKYKWDAHLFLPLLRYGVFAAVSAGLSAALWSWCKSTSASILGHQAVAGLLFSLETTQRVISAIGLSINLLIAQKLITSSECDTRDVYIGKARGQIEACFFFLVPSALGLWVIKDELIYFLVPPDYRSSFDLAFSFSIASSFCLAFKSFAIDSIFISAGRTGLSLIGPAVALFFFFLAMTAVRSNSPSIILISEIFLAANLISLVISVVLMSFFTKVNIPFLHLIKMTACAASLVIVPHVHIGSSDKSELLSLATKILLGFLLYASTSVCLNSLGLKESLFNRFIKGRGRENMLP